MGELGEDLPNTRRCSSLSAHDRHITDDGEKILPDRLRAQYIRVNRLPYYNCYAGTLSLLHILAVLNGRQTASYLLTETKTVMKIVPVYGTR